MRIPEIQYIKYYTEYSRLAKGASELTGGEACLNFINTVSRINTSIYENVKKGSFVYRFSAIVDPSNEVQKALLLNKQKRADIIKNFFSSIGYVTEIVTDDRNRTCVIISW